MTAVQWPQGMALFYRALRVLSPEILGGTLVTIDPSIGSSSSQPGYAVAHAGVLQITGTLRIDPKETVYKRCRSVYDTVSVLIPSPPDVLGIEALPAAFANQKTIWAVSLSIAAADATQTLEIPIPFWKAYARTCAWYQKGDAADARAMCEAMIAWCREVENAVP